MTMELDEAAVRARLEAATPGPWRVENLGSHGEDSWALDIARFRNYTNTVDFGADLATAEFIAHARTDLPAALDEITRLLAALDEARAEVGELRLSRAELADECESLRSWVADGKAREMERIADAVARVTPCSCSAQRARAEAAESALEAVRALVGPANPRSATAGSAYSTGRWDAFAEVRAVLESEVEDGVFGDPEIHARLTRAALATPTTPEETQP